MIDPTKQYSVFPPNEDAISLVEIVNPVLRHWRIVAVLPTLLALVVGVWSLTRDRAYSASASFMPQGGEIRGVGGASALAQQFGVSLGSERPGQSPQFYVDLLSSRTLLRQAVEAEYRIPAEGQVWRGDLVEYWDLDEGGGMLPPWRKATELLGEAISASVSRETGVVHLTVSSSHPVLSELIADRLLALLNEFNLKVRQSRAQEEGRFISDRMTEAQGKLIAAEEALQNFLRHNREFRNSPELVFEYDRLQRQVGMRQEVYTSLLRSEEQTRIDAVRDIPLFTVIDPPAGAAQPQGRKTILRAMIAFILGLMIAVFGAFVSEFARKSREADDPHYREFQSLARQAWEDLRHPNRWFRRTEPATSSHDN